MALAGLAALGVAGAGVAWACFPQPLLTVDAPASARSGDRIVVRGVNFRGRVEIRLDAIDGRRLATASGSRFSADVVVPRVRAGIHVLVGVGRERAGGLSGTGSAPLQIVSSAPAPAPAPADRGTAPGDGRPASPGIAPTAAAAGGAALLALGALLGALLARGRRRVQPR